MSEHGQLEYIISEKSQFMVISFAGEMTKTTIPILEKCQNEVLGHSGNLFVLNLNEVTKVDAHGIPQFVRLQKALREKPGALRICFLAHELGKMLIEKAAIRDGEIAGDLVEALSSLQAENIKKQKSPSDLC